MQEFLSFDAVLVPVFAVEVRSSVFDSGKRFFCIPCPFLGNVIFLESWFCHLFKNTIISSRFCSEFSLLRVLQFMHSGGLLGSTGPGISSSGFIVHSSF